MALTKIGKEGITGISNSSDATAITIDSSERVGIGNSTPSSYESGATDLVVGNTGDTGMTVASGTSNNGSIFFADGTSGGAKYEGQIRYNHGSNFMMLATGGSERVRIDASGNTIHGATSSIGDSNANFHIAGNSNDGNETVLYLRNHNTPSGKYHKVGPTNNQGFIVYNQDNVGQYQTSGGTSWVGTSDERLKTDLTPIENGLQKVSTLRAVTGRFITDEESVSRSFLIAQDVQAVLPEAVDVQDDEQGTLGLSYTEVIPLLVASIKELKTELDNAKARITALESE